MGSGHCPTLHTFLPTPLPPHPPPPWQLDAVRVQGRPEVSTVSSHLSLSRTNDTPTSV